MPPSFTYDVFLSHNSQDKALVRALAEWLGRNGVTCWLDEAVLLPGDILTDKLGLAMEQSMSAIVCIGPEGEGPWMSEEVNTLLNKAIKVSRQQNEFRIVPVLLPGAATDNLRWFLKTRLWVDLKSGITGNEAELARLRAAILGERGEDVAPDLELNPYRGLEAFQQENAQFFFGRTGKCKELAGILKDWRFAAIVGPSGNGKSSLARAGLATEAAQSILPGIASWRRLIFTPGSNLTRSLLTQLYSGEPDGTRAGTVDEALKRIQPPDSAPATWAAHWAEAVNAELQTFYPAPQEKVLVFVDQFEEIFTHRGLNTTTEEEHKARILRMLNGLAHLKNKGDIRWHFVLAMRSDFEQRCRLSADFWNLLEKEHLRLPLDELDEEGWREAIKGPAARAGAYLEAGLVETMVKDVFRQRGSMPLLQLALQSLWEKRDGACLTHAAYTEIGGVANALQTRAETCLGLLKTEDAEYYEIARNLFLRLTSPGEGVSDTRRRLDRSELQWEQTDAAKVEHVVSVLSAASNRLITTDGEAVEVTHEVLIRECASIRGWIENVRSEIPMLRRLTHSARQWQAAGRSPEKLRHTDSIQDLTTWAGKTSLRLTTLERAFIASLVQADEDATKREAKNKANLRLTARIASAFAIFTLIVAGVAIYNYDQASKAKEAADAATLSAQTALVTSFVRTVGVQDYGGPSSDIEHEALWEIATLDAQNEAVRIKLLNQWASEGSSVFSPFVREGKGFHAAAGLAPSRVPWSKFQQKMVSALMSPENAGEDGLNSMSAALPAVMAHLSPDVFDAEIEAAQSFPLSQGENLHFELEGLKTLASRSDSNHSARMATRFLEVVQALPAESSDTLELISALEVFLPGMDKESQQRLCASALNFIEKAIKQPAFSFGPSLQVLECFEVSAGDPLEKSYKSTKRDLLLLGLALPRLNIDVYITPLKELSLDKNHTVVLRQAWAQTLFLCGPQMTGTRHLRFEGFEGYNPTATTLASLLELTSSDQAQWFAELAVNASLNRLEEGEGLSDSEFQDVMRVISSTSPKIRRQSAEPCLTRLLKTQIHRKGDYGLSGLMESSLSEALTELAKHLDAGQRYALVNMLTDVWVSPSPPEHFPVKCFETFIEESIKGMGAAEAQQQRQKIAALFKTPGIPDGFGVIPTARILASIIRAAPSDEATNAIPKLAADLVGNGYASGQNDPKHSYSNLITAHELLTEQARGSDQKALTLQLFGHTRQLIDKGPASITPAEFENYVYEIYKIVTSFPIAERASDSSSTDSSSILTTNEATSVGSSLLTLLLRKEVSKGHEYRLLKSLEHVLPGMDDATAAKTAKGIFLAAGSLDRATMTSDVDLTKFASFLSQDEAKAFESAFSRTLDETLRGSAAKDEIADQLEEWKALCTHCMPQEAASQHIAGYIQTHLSKAKQDMPSITRWLDFLFTWDAPLPPDLSTVLDSLVQKLVKIPGNSEVIDELERVQSKYSKALKVQTHRDIALAAHNLLRQSKSPTTDVKSLLKILLVSLASLPQEDRVSMSELTPELLVDLIHTTGKNYGLQSVETTTVISDLASLSSRTTDSLRLHAELAEGLLFTLKQPGTNWSPEKSAHCLLQLIKPIPVKLSAVERYALSAICRATSPAEDGDKQAQVILDTLTIEDLVDVLKWPTCIGENRTRVLAILEKKTGKTFGGDLWQFVKEAPGLGITEEVLKRAPSRPAAELAVKELEQFIKSSSP